MAEPVSGANLRLVMASRQAFSPFPALFLKPCSSRPCPIKLENAACVVSNRCQRHRERPQDLRHVDHIPGRVARAQAREGTLQRILRIVLLRLELFLRNKLQLKSAAADFFKSPDGIKWADRLRTAKLEGGVARQRRAEGDHRETRDVVH